MAESRFQDLATGHPREMDFITSAFQLDPDPKKENLAMPTFQTDKRNPWVLPVVRAAEKKLAYEMPLDYEYMPFMGLQAFTKGASRLLLGDSCKALYEKRVFGVQAVGGTGALRLGAEILTRILSFRVCYTSQPTREDQSLVLEHACFTSHMKYRYWDVVKKQLDMKGLLEDLQSAPENSVVVLQACAHNPTGMDPSEDDWVEIAKIMKKRKLFPLFDCAYQGFASGELDKDAWVVRYFVECGFELLAAQSFSKNFGLYNDRVGNLTVVMKDPEEVANVQSQIEILIRGMYLNAPNHGAQVVAIVLHDQLLSKGWRMCLRTMAYHMRTMRNKLRERLIKLKTPGDWDHLTRQIGMFSATGLNTHQVDFLRIHHSIYMLSNGYINVCSLNNGNIEYVANCIHDTVTKIQQERDEDE